MSSSARLLHSLQKAAIPAASQDPTRISMACTGCGSDNRGGPPQVMAFSPFAEWNILINHWKIIAIAIAYFQTKPSNKQIGRRSMQCGKPKHNVLPFADDFFISGMMWKVVTYPLII